VHQHTSAPMAQLDGFSSVNESWVNRFSHGAETVR